MSRHVVGRVLRLLSRNILLLQLLFVATTANAQPFDVKDLDFDKGETMLGLVTGFQKGRARGGSVVPRVGSELEAARGLTDYWLLTAHVHFDDEAGLGVRTNHVTLENVFKLHVPREQGLNAGWYTGVEFGTQNDQTNRVIFGPVLSWKSGRTTVNANPFLDQSFGRNREDGIAFVYATHAKYEIAKGLEIGLEGYGRIEDVGNALPFQQQEHRLGPALFIEREIGQNRHVHAAFGVLVGVTDAVPDVAFKANFWYSFKD